VNADAAALAATALAVHLGFEIADIDSKPRSAIRPGGLGDHDPRHDVATLKHADVHHASAAHDALGRTVQRITEYLPLPTDRIT
jgi:hypothetical protein